MHFMQKINKLNTVLNRVETKPNRYVNISCLRVKDCTSAYMCNVGQCWPRLSLRRHAHGPLAEQLNQVQNNIGPH